MALPLSHLHLHVHDLPRAVAWYRQQLGLHLTRDLGDLVFLGDDRGFDLALALDPHAAPLPDWFHFGCRLASADAVRAAYARAQASGVAIASPLAEHEGEFVTVRLADPDGHRVEVYFEPAPGS
jgi:catechol 2,3-dioxygenase-like lactoylglutathione lyase family enzyme